MTEDDTFQALRRIPYEEVFELFSQWLADRIYGMGQGVHVTGTRDQFFKQYGWTKEEYNNEFKRRHYI